MEISNLRKEKISCPASAWMNALSLHSHCIRRQLSCKSATQREKRGCILVGLSPPSLDSRFSTFSLEPEASSGRQLRVLPAHLVSHPFAISKLRCQSMATTMLVAPGLRALSLPQEKVCGYQLKRETHLRSYCFRPRKQSQSIRALISSGATSRWNWLRFRSIQEYAVATVAVIVVQAIIAQDVSHALFNPSLLVTDFTASSCPKKSFRCTSAKKFKPGLVRLRSSATPSLNGSSARRQGRSKGGFAAGTTGRSLGGELNASSTVVKAAPLAVLPSSPLASLVSAGSHVDLNVLRASFASSLNLISLCSFVVWMQRSGQLPAETPVVLSQVAFRVLIPCFLMTKVAVTLASHPSASLLVLPLLGFVQVVMGALIGKVAYRCVYGKAPARTYSASVSPSPSPAVVKMSSSENGAGVITQLETPVSTITLPRHSEQYITTKREAIITTACAFGNSFTLPLIFMTGVLGAEETSKVAGYLALYMVGWSPALWTLGYYAISAGDEDGESASKDRFSWTSIVKTFKRIMNPPLYGVLVGVLIGGTPLSHLFLPVANECAAMSTSTGALAILCSSTAGILKPVVDAAALLGTATLAVQTIVLASSLAASLPPLGKNSSSRLVEPAVAETEAGALDAVLDTRAFWIISSVRLIAMPGLMIIATVMLQCARILPVDPVYNLLLLTEAAMPSAQNLVLLSQLRASTRRLSGVLADLLLRQYALSIIPITFWMALFLAVVKPV